ncbi:hypothetical protein B5S30_g658 [[Candida] boidinii]|nr:hypothetical protein B5S30_g658 [[Candida] boidinii]
MPGRVFSCGAIFQGSPGSLVSTVLAGVKRSTGLTPNFDSIQDENIKGIGQKYLGFGEYCYDSSVAFMSASSYFQRK